MQIFIVVKHQLVLENIGFGSKTSRNLKLNFEKRYETFKFTRYFVKNSKNIFLQI